MLNPSPTPDPLPALEVLDPRRIKRSSKPLDKDKPLVFLGALEGKGTVVIKLAPTDEGADLSRMVSKLHPAFLRLHPDYELGVYGERERRYFVYQYYGRNIWMLLRAIQEQYDTKALPARVVLYCYTLALNMMKTLQRLHDVPLTHGDVTKSNTVADDEGRVHLVDCGDVRPLTDPPQRLAAYTTKSVRRGPDGRVIPTASIENDLRGLAFVICQLVLFNYFDAALKDLAAASDRKDFARVRAIYDTLFIINELAHPAPYRPFITCGKALADERIPVAGKLQSQYTFLEGHYREYAAEKGVMLRRDADDQYLMRKPSSSCSIL